MNNEWIFDNASQGLMQKKLLDLDSSGDLLARLNFDVSKIKWSPFIMNHMYGIKRYILKEESYLPSLGLFDSRTILFNPVLDDWLPWR